MYLIRQLAKKYKLTRTSLLHYDAIGLLSPSARTKAGYRIYSEEDEKKLKNILLFRSMGISLDNIKQLLKYNETMLANALLIRLNDLNKEIMELRQRQKNIINLLKEVKTIEKVLSDGNQEEIRMNLLNNIKPEDWHKRFEAMSPDIHQEFLKIQNLNPDSIKELIKTFPDYFSGKQLHASNKIINKK